MTIEEFEFNLVQVELVINHCRSKFKLKEHQAAYNDLLALFNSVKSRYRNFDAIKLRECSEKLLERIYLGVEFLHYKKFSDVPIHLTKCLELAFFNWVDNPAFFSIVFSHNSSTLRDFTTWPHYEKDINKLCLALKLGVDYKHRLIQISQPRFFKEEFLSSIACYHELGHFVESYYSIAYHIVVSSSPFVYRMESGVNLDNGNRDHANQIYYYMREHFCDLYAAQYIGIVMAECLNFIAENDGFASTHPSTEKRKRVIQTFIDGSGSPEDLQIVNRIKQATATQTTRAGKARELNDKMLPLTDNPFILDKALKLQSEHEVHSLLVNGWRNYMDSTTFSNKYLIPTVRNKRINHLIKKTLDVTFFNRSLFTKLFHY